MVANLGCLSRMVRRAPGSANGPAFCQFADAVLSVLAQVTSQSSLLGMKSSVFLHIDQ